MSPITSVDNFKYYVLFVDHFTRFTWLYPLKLKSQVQATFIAFKALVENRFNEKIKTLYSDNGGEYLALRQFLQTHGISHLTSPPHTPEHNGISERKHRHIVETGLTLLSQASMPTSYWSYAFTTAVYLINRMPTPVLNNTSPYAKLFQHVPNYHKLRVFGSACYPWLRPYANNKMAMRSTECVFFGYSLTQSAYLCLDRSSGRTFVSRHVQFIEDKFPFATPPKPTPQPEMSQTSPPFSVVPLTLSPHPAPLVSAPSMPSPGGDPHRQATPDIPSSSSSLMNDVVLSSDNTQVDPGIESTTPSGNAQVCTQTPTPPIITTQPAQPPPPANPATNIPPMRTRAKNQIHKRNTKHSLLTIKHQSTPMIPTTVTQALRDEKWRNAMGEEMDSQIRNRTYDLVPSHPSQHVISTKWLFSHKYFPDGTLKRHKARWVARGHRQQQGIDYS